MKMNKKGFTLIEMLVVIAIIAILVAIIVPTVTSATTKAAAATNAANLRTAAAELAIQMLNGEATKGDDGTITAKSGWAAPTMKAVTGITGGTFSAKVDASDNIICAFGTDGTIANYSTIADKGKLS